MDKIYYSIAEVSQLTQLPVSTLRYWEEQFTQLKPHKNATGKRFYTERDIALIKRIKFVRDELKIKSIAAIKKELLRDTKKIGPRQKTTEILMDVRAKLVELRKLI